MIRIFKSHAIALCFLLASASAGAQSSAPSAAQPRVLPEQARLGTLEVVVFPQARLDGKPVLMAPGARIWNASNMIAAPASIGGAAQVLYRLDPMGQINEAWILSPEELRRAQESRASAKPAFR